MIKGFLFDYDGVMTKAMGSKNPSDRLAILLKKTPTEIGELCMSFWPDYLLGKFTEEELWAYIAEKSGIVIPEEHRNIWSHWEQLQPLPEMLELVRSLRDAACPVGLLTNVTPTTEEEIRTHSGYDGFDFLVRSCKVGFAKPDREIYDIAMDHFGLAPHEIVFVDDRERFLEPARQVGMKTVLAVDSKQVIYDISKLVSLQI